MTSKNARRTRILELVRRHQVSSQEELAVLLERAGIAATQSTLSRDIRELGLIKASDDGAHYRYAPVEAVAPPGHMKASAILARLVRKVDCSGNLLVIKTDPGEANPIGLALDRMGWSEVVGTVAGDDTLLVVVKEGVPARKLAKRILDLKSHKKDSA